MAIYLKSLRVFGGQNLDAGIVFERSGQVPQLPVYFRDNRVVRQALADGTRYVQGLCPGRDGLLAAIGQRYDKAAHDYGFNP